MDLLLSKYVSFVHKIPVDQYHNAKTLTMLADRFGSFSKTGSAYSRQELFRKNLNQIQVRFMNGRRPHGLIKIQGQGLQPLYSGQLWQDLLLRRPEQHRYFQQRETRQYAYRASPYHCLAARQSRDLGTMLARAEVLQHGEEPRQRTKAERDHHKRCDQAHGWFWYRIADGLRMRKRRVLSCLAAEVVSHER